MKKISVMTVLCVMSSVLFAASDIVVTLEEVTITAPANYTIDANSSSPITNLKLVKINPTSDHPAGFEVKFNSGNGGKFKLTAGNNIGESVDYTANVQLEPGESTNYSGTVTTPAFNPALSNEKIIDVVNPTGNFDAVFYMYVDIQSNELRSAISSDQTPDFQDNMVFTISEK